MMRRKPRMMWHRDMITLGTVQRMGKGGQSSAEGFTVAKGAIANLASEAIQQAIDKFKELTIESEKSL